MQLRFVASIVAVAVTSIAVPTHALAAVPPAGTPWRIVSEHQGQNYDEVGLVRGADGMLHVVYSDNIASQNVGIRHRTVSPTGALGAPTSVISGWASVNQPDVEIVSGAPHVFWGGQGTTDVAVPTSTGQAWYASLAGGAWTLSASPMTVNTTPYASTAVGSAVDTSGAPWIAWSSTFGLKVHAGLPLAGTEQDLTGETGCCDYASNIGRDNATGDLYVNYYSNATGRVGMWSRRIAPTLGDPVALSGGATASGDSLSRTARLSAAARTTGGVYSAHCATYPSCTTLAVSASSGPSLRLRLAENQQPTLADSVWTAAAPNGRMWLSWANRSGVFAVRSNKALTKWGPVQKFAGPAGTDTIWRTTGEGSNGYLDLFAGITTMPGDALRQQYTRFKPALTVTRAPASVRSNVAHTVKFVVTDAGDGLVAKVRFRGVTRTTNAAGKVSFPVPTGTRAGSYPVVVTVNGYVTASTTVTVRR